MNRGINIVGIVLASMLALVGFIQSITTLIELDGLWMLLVSVPAAVIGTTLALYFAHEFYLTLLDARAEQQLERDMQEFAQKRAERLRQLKAKLSR